MTGKLSGKTIASALILGLLVALPAAAEYRSYSYYELYGYDSELQHCVDLLRPNLMLKDDERARFIVDEISLRGPWYNFSIRASVIADDGSTRLDDFRVNCKSNRWIETARLKKSRNTAASSDLTLFVTNTSELVSHVALARNSAVE